MATPQPSYLDMRTNHCEAMAVDTRRERDEAFAAELRARVQAQRERSVALRRIRADYGEMPGLRVTVRQGARLWSLPVPLCESLLDELVAEAFLVRSGDHFRLP